MRVITGIAKGKKLKALKSNRVRPTSDRIKEAIFSIIGDDIIDSIFIDCYAGTGSIGIEAISRGARKCYFLENHFESIKLIKENLNHTKLTRKGIILSKNVYNGLKEISSIGDKADIIFMDPPYAKDYLKPTLESIVNYDILHKEGYIILEHSKNEILNDQKGLEKYREKIYGNTVLSFYKKEEV